MIHTSITENCTVFHLCCKLTRSAIYGSQKFDSHKWPTVVKGKPCNFEAHLCGSLYSTFFNIFLSICILHAFQRPTRPIQGNVFL